MLRLLLTCLSLGIISSNCDVFNVHPDLLEKNQQCQDFNDTLYKYVNNVLSRLNRKFPLICIISVYYFEDLPVVPHPIQRIKREAGGKFYNFTVHLPQGWEVESKYLYLYTKVPDSYKFPYESGDSPLPFFLPLYSIEATTFEGFPDTFVLITGERCRWKCDNLTKQCDLLTCWRRPSVCIGQVKQCAKFDGDGTCTKISDIKEEIQSQSDEFSSTDFGNLFKINAGTVFIDDQGYWERTPAGVRYWNCSLTSESKAYCYNSQYFLASSIGY